MSAIPKKLLNMNDVMTGSRVYEIFMDKFNSLSSYDKATMLTNLGFGDDKKLKSLLDKVGQQVTLEAKQNIKEEPIYKIAIVAGIFAAAGLFSAGYYIAKYRRRK